jgi:uncharacterized protein (DUF1697 family)
MNRYAALLRGIMPSNPNMRGEKLRGVFEGLGFESVGSVLASGNIVFSAAETDAPALESRIQQALKAELGIAGGTLVRSSAELHALAVTDPFAGLAHSRGSYLTVTFVKLAAPVAPPDPPAELGSRVRIAGFDSQIRAVYAIIDNAAAGSTPNLMAWLEKFYGKDNVTTRTWPTVTKVLAKL